MGDPVFAVKNSFYLGAYQTAINEGSDMEELNELEAVERDYFTYRSYIAQGSCQMVVDEVKQDAATALQGVKLYAQLLQSEASKESVLEQLQGWLADPVSNGNPYLLAMAGYIYMHVGDLAEAMKTVHSTSTLELYAIQIQCLLKLDRVDLAERQVRNMQAMDDDATLTQLATAWVDIAIGGAKVQEAFHIYQDLGDKYAWTSTLYNGLATCNMQMGRWEEAESTLMEALNKDAKDPDTLANMITCALHMGKPTSRHLNQLKLVAPAHVVVQKYNSLEDTFNRSAAAFA